jgi:hypothetical protein
VTDEATTAPRPTIGAAVRTDWRSSAWRQRLVLIGVAAWLAYEWGPGNESVTPWLVVRVLDRNDGVAAVVWPTVVGFAFTFAQQLASGLTTALGVAMFPRTADAAWHRLSASGDREFHPWSAMRIPTKVAIAFGLGTTAAVVAESALTGQVGLRRHARVVVSAACWCATTVGALAFAVSSLAAVGRSVPALAGATDRITGVLGSPLFWFVLITVTLVVGALRSWRNADRATARSGARVDGDQQVE